MRIEQKAAAAAVAAIADSTGMPAAERMAGLANRMYAIVRNVVTPPRISREGVVPRAASAARTALRHGSRRRNSSLRR